MKKYAMLLAALMLVIGKMSAQNDAITRFFDKYMEDEKFTVVFVSPKMFQLVSKVKTDDPEWEKTKEVVRTLTGLRVLVGEDMDGIKLYKEALTKVPKSEYSELLTVRDKDENVRIWIKEGQPSVINELLLLVGSTDEFVLLSLTGTINLDQISRLSTTLDIEGAEHLNKVAPKKQ